MYIPRTELGYRPGGELEGTPVTPRLKWILWAGIFLVVANVFALWTQLSWCLSDTSWDITVSTVHTGSKFSSPHLTSALHEFKDFRIPWILTWKINEGDRVEKPGRSLFLRVQGRSTLGISFLTLGFLVLGVSMILFSRRASRETSERLAAFGDDSLIIGILFAAVALSHMLGFDLA